MEQRFLAKLFQNGGSQAVRLPKECRMPGDTVAVTRQGARLIIEPMEPARWSDEALQVLFSGDEDPDLVPEREQPAAQERPELEEL